MDSSPWRIVPVLVVVGTVVGVVQGAEEAKSELDEMVITATRDERMVKDAPYYTDILDTDYLRTEGAFRSLPEALKHQTGTLVQRTAHGQGSPYVRGFTGFRNLFLIDGIRLNNSVFRDGPNQYWNTVDPLSLSRIEFIKGPFSVLYGSDAVGGTLSAITRGAQDLDPDKDWQQRLYYRFASAEDANIGRAETGGRLSENVVATVGLSVKDFGDVEGGKDVGTQEKTGYSEQDWDAKIEYFPADNTRVVLAHQGVNQDDAWRAHKTIYGITWEGLKQGKEKHRILDQDRRLTYLQYHRTDMDGFCREIHAGISHHLQSEERDRLRTSGHDVQGFDVSTLGCFIQAKNETGAGELIYGTEYYYDDVDSFKYKIKDDGSTKSSIQGPIGDDSSYDLLGVYVQDAIALGEVAEVILGARYDYAAAEADKVEDPDTGDEIRVSDSWDNVVGSARALCHLNDDKSCNVFAGISQGFRAPNLSDLTRLDSARTDEIETPSPDLEPEEFVSFEVGVKGKAGGFSSQAAYFYTDIQDMIVRTPTGRMIGEEYEVTKKNAGDGYVQGIETQMECVFAEQFKAFGSITWMDGEVDTYPTSDPALVTEPIDRLMPLTGRIGLRWTANEKVWLEGAVTSAEKADELSTRDSKDTSRIPPGGTPAYTVGDIRAGWKAAEGLTISLAVENITDEDYRIHGSGVNEPGRNIVLAADWMF